PFVWVIRAAREGSSRPDAGELVKYQMRLLTPTTSPATPTPRPTFARFTAELASSKTLSPGGAVHSRADVAQASGTWPRPTAPRTAPVTSAAPPIPARTSGKTGRAGLAADVEGSTWSAFSTSGAVDAATSPSVA